MLLRIISMFSISVGINLNLSVPVDDFSNFCNSSSIRISSTTEVYHSQMHIKIVTYDWINITRPFVSFYITTLVDCVHLPGKLFSFKILYHNYMLSIILNEQLTCRYVTTIFSSIQYSFKPVKFNRFGHMSMHITSLCLHFV